MTSRIKAAFLGAAISMITINAIPQLTPTPPGGEGSSAPLRSSDILSAKGIAISHTSLTAALHDKDPSIRTAAAVVLAQHKDSEAIPLVESALATESNPKTVVEMASVLMSLGDAVGTDRLTRICTDPSAPSRTVSYAVLHLSLRHSGAKCIDELVRRLRNPSTSDNTVQLIPSLSSLSKLASPTQQTEILATLQKHLDDKDPQTRIMASRAVVQTASPNSVDVINAALQRESDPVVRASMEADLTRLVGKAH